MGKVTLATPYSAMSKDQLWDEMAAWQKVVDAPKGPGGPSNAERAAAAGQMALAGAWVHRLKNEEER